MSIKKITYGGLMIAVAILLPQVFHLTGVAQAGQVFLPMHIPVLMSGFLLGPLFGLFIGIISPLISSLITGMPAIDRVIFMMLELAAYGLTSGLFYEKLGFRKRRFGIYISLAAAMAAGRIVYGLSLIIAGNLLGIKGFDIFMMFNALIMGVWGIVIQLVFLPSVIYGLERSGNFDKFIRKSKSSSL